MGKLRIDRQPPLFHALTDVPDLIGSDVNVSYVWMQLKHLTNQFFHQRKRLGITGTQGKRLLFHFSGWEKEIIGRLYQRCDCDCQGE